MKIDNNKLTLFQEHLLCCNYPPSFEDIFILTRESNDFKLKIMESLLIACEKLVLNKSNPSLPLELFWYNISGYHMIFYHIIWYLSVPLCVYNCRLSSFQYFVTSFNTLSKTECISIQYYFRRDHESNGFRKPGVNKWICRKSCDYFLD